MENPHPSLMATPGNVYTRTQKANQRRAQRRRLRAQVKRLKSTNLQDFIAQVDIVLQTELEKIRNNDYETDKNDSRKVKKLNSCTKKANLRRAKKRRAKKESRKANASSGES